MAIASGITRAAPAPWSDLAAISASTLPDLAHAIDARVNRKTPGGEHRPAQHLSAAPISSSTAKVRL
jgi:hypothetical protein